MRQQRHLHYRCPFGSMTNSRSISVFGDAQMLKRKTLRLVPDLDECDTEFELVGSSCTDPPSNVHDTIGNRALYTTQLPLQLVPESRAAPLFPSSLQTPVEIQLVPEGSAPPLFPISLRMPRSAISPPPGLHEQRPSANLPPVSASPFEPFEPPERAVVTTAWGPT